MRVVRETEVVQRVHDVVRILRQVPELERVDLEHDERERCGHADAHRRDTLAVKPLRSHFHDPVIVRQEVNPARVPLQSLRELLVVGAGLRRERQ